MRGHWRCWAAIEGTHWCMRRPRLRFHHVPIVEQSNSQRCGALQRPVFGQSAPSAGRETTGCRSGTAGKRAARRSLMRWCAAYFNALTFVLARSKESPRRCVGGHLQLAAGGASRGRSALAPGVDCGDCVLHSRRCVWSLLFTLRTFGIRSARRLARQARKSNNASAVSIHEPPAAPAVFCCRRCADLRQDIEP